MNILTKVIKSQKCRNLNWRQFSSILREELTVQTFCDIQVKVPYNVKIKPLDVHKYHNCDLLRFELQGADTTRCKLKHIQDGNNVQIFAASNDYDQYTTCFVQAPVKANLNVTAQGSISAGVFSGSKLTFNSLQGNIVVDRFEGENISLTTRNGDIIMKGPVIASTIKAVVENNGTIKTKRLQGTNAMLKTNQGNISVDASYCDNVIFEAVSGNLNLQNIHKHSKIILKNGRLSLIALDGELEAALENSLADIQVSRILGNSKVNMTGNGDLNLLLSEACQENTHFEIKTKDYILDPVIKLIPSRNDSTLYLTPTFTDHGKHVFISCDKGQTNIKSVSWLNMAMGMKK